jgi:hypothetical protein
MQALFGTMEELQPLVEILPKIQHFPPHIGPNPKMLYKRQNFTFSKCLNMVILTFYTTILPNT